MSRRAADEPAETPARKSFSALLRTWTRSVPSTASKSFKDNGKSNAIWADKRTNRYKLNPVQGRRRKPSLGEYFKAEDVQRETSTCSTACSSACSSTPRLNINTPATSEDEMYELSPVAKVADRGPRKASTSCCMAFLHL
ncbi:unnamed protein product [Symbiodinium pilosum]|uniref:Uncharacterized protein n=1 Tax=Symbiodinium pilosum TaxID=2952 RepID=A0A812M3Q6_SYMPI|nr:unnamed protein product [Symbiodinium pilosum]